MAYILNCTSTPNYLLPNETVEATKPLATQACLEGFTALGLEDEDMVKSKISATEIFAIKDCLLSEPNSWTINGEKDEKYFVEAALRKVFSNSDMAFGSGTVILDTNTRIGELTEIALRNKNIKTLTLPKKN